MANPLASRQSPHTALPLINVLDALQMLECALLHMAHGMPVCTAVRELGMWL